MSYLTKRIRVKKCIHCQTVYIENTETTKYHTLMKCKPPLIIIKNRKYRKKVKKGKHK